jgi:hypothetical protein
MGKKLAKKAIAGNGKPANKGQWKKKQSGNPNGRPPKKPAQLLSLAETLGACLAEEITVTTGHGIKQTLPMGQVLAKTIINDLLKVPLKERMIVLCQLVKLGAFDEMQAIGDMKDEGQPILPPEALRLLAITKKAIEECDGVDEDGSDPDDDFDAGTI